MASCLETVLGHEDKCDLEQLKAWHMSLDRSTALFTEFYNGVI